MSHQDEKGQQKCRIAARTATKMLASCRYHVPARRPARPGRRSQDSLAAAPRRAGQRRRLNTLVGDCDWQAPLLITVGLSVRPINTLRNEDEVALAPSDDLWQHRPSCCSHTPFPFPTPCPMFVFARSLFVVHCRHPLFLEVLLRHVLDT